MVTQNARRKRDGERASRLKRRRARGGELLTIRYDDTLSPLIPRHDYHTTSISPTRHDADTPFIIVHFDYAVRCRGAQDVGRKRSTTSPLIFTAVTDDVHARALRHGVAPCKAPHECAARRLMLIFDAWRRRLSADASACPFYADIIDATC